MWLVAKYKKNQYNFLKSKIKDVFGSTVNIYNPKIKLQKFGNNKIIDYEKYILNGYFFLKHSKLPNINILNNIKYLRGIEFILDGFIQNQKEILMFINKCKTSENEHGFLKQSFFESAKYLKNGEFISGPFTNLFFKILSEEKNKMKILIGKRCISISNSSDCLYRSF
tara:strand:+ start:492 stop:995 length:504 start_codon:yes stop_codon:yes gene_type:complete